MDLGLDGQVALVTAASRGLGKAAAMAMGREGARLAIFARSEQVRATADEIRKETGADVLAIQGDLLQPADIERAVAEARKAYGQIDILITNAGGPKPGEFLDLAPPDWEDAFQLTLMSAVRLCYAVIPHMLERGSGSIVASQSYLVKEPAERLMLSNSLRLAVIGMMKTLANELGPRGIRVNTINPAWTWTDRIQQLMTDRAQANATSVDMEAKKITDAIPLGRMGMVEEYGKTIAWLASPAASFIHGHALMFDGGIVKAVL
jgi:3-oxoacyl-[acyl-carrier protein] reductase